MTLIGQHTALVSLGISCQTAHQLRRHAGMLSSMVNDDLQVVRMPFDWLIAPIASTTTMIANNDYFPQSIGELDWCQHPYWSRHDCFFWHEDAVFDNPAPFMSRFFRASVNIVRLAASAITRRIFIVSNSQNALPFIATSVGGIDIRYTDQNLSRLASLLEERWPRSELYAVGYEHFSDCVDRDGFFPLVPDDSVWKGDDGQWHAILSDIAARRVPSRRRLAEVDA